MLFGKNSKEVADPVMVGKRGFVTDSWNNLRHKLHSLKEKYMPQVEKATQVKLDVA